MLYKLDLKLFLLWMLLLAQVILLAYYVFQMPPSAHTQSTAAPKTLFSNKDAVKFLPLAESNVSSEKPGNRFLTANNKISLPFNLVDKYFVNFNGTVCYTLGTNIDNMKGLISTDNNSNKVKCECKQGYHGQDCGQPEVVWRAFMASRQKIIPRRRRTSRRIIYTFALMNLETTLVEILINELDSVTDLFVVTEANYTEAGNTKTLNFQQKLTVNNLGNIANKILYVPYSKGASSNNSKILDVNKIRQFLWLKSKKIIKNIQLDDLFILMGSQEIPNIKALQFFKIYDGWPQPVWFRLCWTVYGFFWQHPKKTILAPGAATIEHIEDTLGNDASKLKYDTVGYDQNLGQTGYGLMIGDLNHYGGWFCSWCLEPSEIIETLKQTPNSEDLIQWGKTNTKTIDSAYVEDMIGSGLWLDGKTVLQRRSRHQDQYFAPEYVMNNTWKYESIITNFYTDLDYR